MHHDPKRDVEVAQARYAERLDVEPDPVDAAVRHVVLDGQRLAKLLFVDDVWGVSLLIDGEYRTALHTTDGDLDDTDDADLLGIGWVAHALARGELRHEGGRR